MLDKIQHLPPKRQRFIRALAVSTYAAPRRWPVAPIGTIAALGAIMYALLSL